MSTYRGMGMAAIIALVAIVLVAGGALYVATMPKAEKMMGEGKEMMQEGETMMKEAEDMMGEGETMMKEGEVMMEKEGGAMMESSYQGDVFAEGEGGAILLDFTHEDYEKAIASGKLVTLFFFANWCPICREEFPKMEQAFMELDADVIGFRVNYNDNQTDSNEKELAREFGVAYQHTKVFIKNGERILKSPEGWEKDRYLIEINNAL